MSDEPDQQEAAPPPIWRRLGLGFAFLAPCAVIALSIFLIVKGGANRAAAPALSSAAPAPSAAVPDLAALSSAAPLAREPEFAGPVVGEVSADEAGIDEGGVEEPTPAKPAVPKRFATVQLAAAGSCSTESVDGLSRQIIEQARCIKPNDFVALPKRPNLAMAPNVFPYLEQGARDNLLKALASKPTETMTINSALRTVAQQYLVWHWSASKTCGVQLATQPGESNHEIGFALDIAEAGKWRPALEAQNFRWLGKSDRVHFDYKGAMPAAHTATDVLAFQKLWNRNHKEDMIAETGRYNPATEQRLKKSPATGFPLGASCRAAAPKR